jgi:hypothetical protein
VVPAPFRSLRALRLLNVAAVGLSLAACTAAVFTDVFGSARYVAVATGVPTLLLGMVWASVLRWPRTVGKSRLRWGWVLSVPLAVLDGAVACGLTMMENEGLTGLGVGLIAGATFGVIFWLPGLLVTLLAFGIPIATAQHQAERGLAGEERGEAIVGFICAAMSATGLLLAALSGRSASSAGLPLSCALGVAGLLAGGTAMALAKAREARRREFVTRAEAGEIPGYRVDPTEEGKVLIRIVPAGEGYRVKDFDQEICELGVEGEAIRPRTVAAIPRP